MWEGKRLVDWGRHTLPTKIRLNCWCCSEPIHFGANLRHPGRAVCPIHHPTQSGLLKDLSTPLESKSKYTRKYQHLCVGSQLIRNHAGPDCVTLNLVTAVGIYSVSWDKIGLIFLLKVVMQLLIPSVFIPSSKFWVNRCMYVRDVILFSN